MHTSGPQNAGQQAKSAMTQLQGAANSPADQFMARYSGNPAQMISQFQGMSPVQQYQMLNSLGGNRLEGDLIGGGMSGQGLAQFINQASYMNAGNNPYVNQPGSPGQTLGSAQSFGGAPGYAPGGLGAGAQPMTPGPPPPGTTPPPVTPPPPGLNRTGGPSGGARTVQDQQRSPGTSMPMNLPPQVLQAIMQMLMRGGATR